MPRLDLLVYVLVTRLTPLYECRVERLLDRLEAGPEGSGRSCYEREAPWRKAFKADWSKLAKAKLMWSRSWRTDALRWTCDCPMMSSHRCDEFTL
jgi:hypothetical protein